MMEDANKSNMDDVPPIVVDLVWFFNNRGNHQVPRSLTSAMQKCEAIGEGALVDVCINLMSWWGGNDIPGPALFARQKNSVTLQMEWNWCKALPEVIEACDDLATLIEIVDGVCRFRKNLDKRLRRRIKNYVRDHREWPRLMT